MTALQFGALSFREGQPGLDSGCTVVFVPWFYISVSTSEHFGEDQTDSLC